jgi:CheY-like chemotaxis protein
MIVSLVETTDRRPAELLRAAGMNVVSISAGDLAALAAPAARQPDVVVVDVRGASSIPPAIAAVRRQHPDTAVVILASALDPALLLEAMRAGVNEVVAEPFEGEDLERALSRVAEQAPAGETGHVFGFIGAKGGVGTTTVAVNMAASLGAISKPARTLLIDLHQSGGDAAVFTGAEPRFSIAADTRNPQYQALKGKRFAHQLCTRTCSTASTSSGSTKVSRIRGRARDPRELLIQTLLERENQRAAQPLRAREPRADVLHELFGLGPLETLLADPSSPTSWSTATQVYIEREGKIEETDIVFRDDKHLMQIIERIVSAVGRRIDESSPMVDARLQDGSRVNVIIPPLALDGPALSIRRFRTDRLGRHDLVERESLTAPMLDFLQRGVAAADERHRVRRHGRRQDDAAERALELHRRRERVVTIEDAAELKLRQRHVVRLETRPPNIEGKGPCASGSS